MYFIASDIDKTKSTNDRKQYRLLELENGLQILLIQFTSGDDCEHDDNDEVMEESMYDGSTYDDSDESVSHGSDDVDEDEDEVLSRTKATRRAGACLTVGVGSFAEPPSLKGSM
jgi:nardilysin